MILGIDQSLTSAGVCLVNDDLTVKHGFTVHGEGTSNIDRIMRLIERVNDMINIALEERDARLLIAREGYSYQSRTNNAFQLGELGGCINYAIASRINDGAPINMAIIPPMTVKLLCLGRGDIKKDSAYLLTVFKNTSIEFEDDNQADAFLLCKTFELLYSIANTDRAEERISGLSAIQRQALIPPSVRKRNKLTEAKVKQLSTANLILYVKEALETVYGLHHEV